MSEPVVIDYKDQAPIRATSDNERLRASNGDGPAAANIPDAAWARGSFVALGAQ